MRSCSLPPCTNEFTLRHVSDWSGSQVDPLSAGNRPASPQLWPLVHVDAAVASNEFIWILGFPRGLASTFEGCFRKVRDTCYAHHMPMIRDYASTDLDMLYAVALSTGDRGFDASRQFRDPDLLGHVYAAPYAIFEPELALIVEDEQGVAGYCVGALHTRAFEHLLDLQWWPALRQRYPLASVGSSHCRSAGDSGMMQMIHHPPSSPDWLVGAYPSHLHVNLLPRLKGQGYGRRLLSAWHARSRALGSTGFHLGVDPRNTPAIGFYEAMGLRRLFSASTSVPDDVMWFGASADVVDVA